MLRVGDLTKCKIYKIVSLNNPESVYYGHTYQALSQRFASHKIPNSKTTSRIIIEKGDAVILLVEDYPCETENQARAREAFYILNNPCVNKCVPGRTAKDQKKEYYKLNKELILEKKKAYYEIHKDHKTE